MQHTNNGMKGPNRGLFMLTISILLLSLFLFFIGNVPALADNATITFSDPLGSGESLDIYLINATGTYKIGKVNNSETFEFGANEAYNVVLKPTSRSLLENPLGFWDYVMGMLPVLISLITVFLLGIGMIILFVRALAGVKR